MPEPKTMKDIIARLTEREYEMFKDNFFPEIMSIGALEQGLIEYWKMIHKEIEEC